MRWQRARSVEGSREWLSLDAAAVLAAVLPEHDARLRREIASDVEALEMLGGEGSTFFDGIRNAIGEILAPERTAP